MQQTELGARVRAARERARMTQDQLARFLDIPRSGLSDVETGRRSLSAAELVALSRHLRRPLSFFVGGEDAPPDAGPFAVRFRTLHLQADDDGSVDEFERCCRAYQWIEDALQVRRMTQLPAYRWPEPVDGAEADAQGQELANEERNRMALGSDPVRDPFDVVESQGVRVFVKALRTPAVTGIFHYDDDLGACILVNSALHPHRRAYDLLHEYCHALADRPEIAHRSDEADDPRDLVERRANAFAACFLLPRDGVERFLTSRGLARGGDPPGIHDVFAVMVAFGASYQATVWRLLELGYLSAKHAEKYRSVQGITALADRFRQSVGIDAPKHDDPKHRRFGQLVIRAYFKEKISLGRLAELLDIDLDEARELVWASRSLDPADPQLAEG
jgi:Zn-dependent peptidase ImmA (M78 family)/transcriptional regulator with XRE-family HTH domain